MGRLAGKKILLGISGSIAAYKAPNLVRLLVKEGADVQVILTPSAGDFVSPLSLSTVSGKAVFDKVSDGGQWHNHALMGHQADLLLVAPCTANTLAKMAHGLCDNMLLAVYLSANCPVLIAPAMDTDMWQHLSTQANIALLESYGHQIIPVGVGELASGLSGAGRMAEESIILEQLFSALNPQAQQASNRTSNKQALVTAGPTYEALDPVRFLGNHSTGKMGVAMAKALSNAGYFVHLIAGPRVQLPDSPNIQIHSVTTALEMHQSCLELFPKVRVAVMAAAVADYRPEQTAKQKIKKDKNSEGLTIHFVRNPDILADLGTLKTKDQILVGFAMETENEIANAQRKLKKKKADYIVLNSLNDPQAGFAKDTNKVLLLSNKAEPLDMPLQSKEKLAETIISKILG